MSGNQRILEALACIWRANAGPARLVARKLAVGPQRRDVARAAMETIQKRS